MKPLSYHYTTIAHGVPAYNRRPITWAACLDLFLRGMDFDNPQGRHFSIRDCAPHCIVQLRYGLRLQKTSTYTMPTEDEAALARLQKLDPFPSETDVRHALGGFKPTRSLLVKWVESESLSSIIAEEILKLR